jgi:cytochrome c553
MDAGATLPSTPATDPFAVESKCSSGQTYIGEEGSTMRPGEACINCHESRGEGPRLTIAGTVYPTGHEPNDCRGANRDTGVSIVITDADGNEYTLEPNQSGNFTSNQAIATPYTARLVTADGERKMFTPQTIGDCNSCHTQDGMSGAPGRIVLP